MGKCAHVEKPLALTTSASAPTSTLARALVVYLVELVRDNKVEHQAGKHEDRIKFYRMPDQPKKTKNLDCRHQGHVKR